jgi:cytochrome c556
MRDHSTDMRSLARMLSGRRHFNRAEAIGLARQIEASAGENLTQMFKPGGDWRSDRFSRARVGNELEVFKHHATAMKWAAGELADQLEKQPSAEDIRAGLAWSPDWGRGDPYRSRGRDQRGALTREVFTAYSNLKATCSNCHANFRAERR